MTLIDNYFLLYHGIKRANIMASTPHRVEDREYFFETLGLILSSKEKNYEKFLSLSSFSNAIHLLGAIKPYTIETLYKMQVGTLELLQKEEKEEEIEYILNTLSLLNEENILSNEEYNKLSSLLNTIHQNPVNIQKVASSSLFKEEDFLKIKKNLLEIIQELKVIIDSEASLIWLEKIKQYLENQTFSIGVTGVMNAGKSTMLNALMHKELLGTSTIPETANLTIIKQGVPKAEVVYWNRGEWGKVVEQGQINVETIPDVEKYIQEESYNQTISINELSLYTSANNSQKRYNLVKYVTLYEQLKFLSKEIEIVDTPGIDDPVIQREEISRGYLAKCDLMMHLMNVSQSATQKDISFIIDAVLYQNITRLLIVITHADMVSPSQLNEVVEYTKFSIVQQLKKLNKSSRSDEILNAITFTPISGKMALMHRTGKSTDAKQSGFTLEDTGILKIESYLNKTLFGKDSSKSELIVKSTKQQLKEFIYAQKESLKYTLLLQSKSKEELKEEYEAFLIQKQKELKNIEAMRHNIEAYSHEVDLFLERLNTFLKNELLDLKQVLQERVVSEVRYSYEKNKKKAKSSEIALIIDIGIKDGMVDVLREYRYKLYKKFQTITEMFYQKCEIISPFDSTNNAKEETYSLSSKAFQAEFMTFSNHVLIENITTALHHAKATKLSEFENNIKPPLEESFIGIQERVLEKSKVLSSLIVKHFFKELTTPLLKHQEKLEVQESKLLNTISQKHKGNSSIEINLKLQQLQAIEESLKS